MEAEIADLRRRLAEAEAEIARLHAQSESHVHVPTGGERTSAAGTDLLFTVAEKTRMPQIVTDPNQPDNPIVFQPRLPGALRLWRRELIGRN